MSKIRLAAYTTVSLMDGGYVVCFERFNRKEYMGRDKMWHRSPEDAQPFFDPESAEAECVRLRQEDAK